VNVFWNFNDVLVWAGLAAPCLLAGALLARTLHGTPSLQLVAAQFIFYLIWFVFLKLLFQLQYGMPFWSSLGCVAPAGGIALCLLAGPLLAIAVNALALATKAPPVDAPFKELLVSRQLRIVFAVASVLAGPLCEELAFRGFLMPALSKAVGTAFGIILTGIAFSLLHGQQYHWIWQYLVLLAVAGSVFGWARWRYSSTLSGTIVHSSFNCTVLLAQIYG
jgi:uncharacterized protein